MLWVYSAIGIYLLIGLIRAIAQINRGKWGAKGKAWTIAFVMIFWPFFIK
jgi:hypothetical protein